MEDKNGQFQLILTWIEGRQSLNVITAICTATQCGITAAKSLVDKFRETGENQVIFVSPDMKVVLDMNSQITAAGGKCKIEAWNP